MSQADAFQDELDILYNALNQLNAAASPAQQLEAVSAYARSLGATQAALFYFDLPDQPTPAREPPTWAEVVAEWHSDPLHTMRVGMRFDLPASPLWSTLLAGDSILLAQDILADSRIDSRFAQQAAQYGVRGAAALPLRNRDRWIGELWFGWKQPYAFTERDARIFRLLARQSAPVIDSVRLLDQTKNRALELQDANREIDILYNALNQLAQADSPAEQLEAVSLYARETGATQGVLFYFDNPDELPLECATVAAEWHTDPAHAVAVDARFRTLGQPSVESLLRGGVPVLIEDAQAAHATDPVHQAILARHGIRGAAILPLQSKGRWMGILWFSWNRPHRFNARDQRLFTALGQQAAPIIESIRLLEENRVRAVRAEEANRESALLYRASRAINAATTYEDIVSAVTLFGIYADGISLALFEHLDYETASYFEIVAGWPQDLPAIGERLLLVDFPALTTLPRDEVTIIEDVLSDPRIDPLSAASWRDRSTRARISIPLARGKRWLGMLIFCSETPHRYTELERRLAAGIGDLVTAALERVRLQAETEASRQRAEIVAQINANLSQATDEQGILSAVGPLASHYGAILCTLAYASTDESGQITEAKTVAVRASGIGPLETSDLPIIAFQFRDFPLIRMAYEQPDKPLFISGDGTMQEHDSAVEMGWPAAIILPLQIGSQWQGILSFVWMEPQTFDHDLRKVFTEIQPVVASSVAGRRAYLAERQRARELQTVAKVSAVASSILDIHELIKAVSELTRANFTDYHIFIYLVEEADRTLVRVNNPPEDGSRAVVPGRVIDIHNARSLIAYVAREKRGLIVNDITRTPQFTLAPMLHAARSEMAVPMLLNEKLIGVLDVQSEEINRFTDSDLLVMGTLADLIAVAVENARLYERAQEVAALEERNRLARELHDSVSQALYGIALGTRTARAIMERDPARLAEPLDYIMSLAEAALTEMRALIFDLRPETLENEGLINVLKKQLASLQARHGIHAQVELCDEPPLTLEAKETLYRIAREALHNTVKHAKASQISFSMRCTGQEIIMTLADNGVGFDPSSDYPGHLGLKSMQERAARLNGVLRIESAPGKGAVIQARIPLHTPSDFNTS